MRLVLLIVGAYLSLGSACIDGYRYEKFNAQLVLNNFTHQTARFTFDAGRSFDLGPGGEASPWMEFEAVVQRTPGYITSPSPYELTTSVSAVVANMVTGTRVDTRCRVGVSFKTYVYYRMDESGRPWVECVEDGY